MTKETLKMAQNVASQNFQEIRENRHFDRWIVNLADFFQTEKYQLLKLGALNNNVKDTDWSFKDVDPDYERKIDDQLYKVYQQNISSEALVEHHLTKRREDFDAILYIAPETLAKFQIMDDDYISCYMF